MGKVLGGFVVRPAHEVKRLVQSLQNPRRAPAAPDARPGIGSRLDRADRARLDRNPMGSAELDLLRTAIRHTLAGIDDPDEFAQVASAVDWHRVLWLGRRHRTLPILHDHLRRLPPEVCPPSILRQIADLREVVQLQSLGRAREQCQIQALFQERSLPALATDSWMTFQRWSKRPHTFEPDTLLRYLVPAERLEKASRILQAAGHPDETDPGRLIRPGAMPVHLHRGFVRRASAARFWDEAAGTRLGGLVHLHPSARHWLIFRAATCDRTPRSISAAHEIALLCRQVTAADWLSVWSEAGRFGLAPTLARLLAAAHEDLGLAPPCPLPPGETMPAPAGGSVGEGRFDPAEVTAPFLPTAPVVAQRMLQLAGTTSGDLVCDLGCGDGRIAIGAARDFGARARGIDLDPHRIAEAQAFARQAGLGDRVEFTQGNLFAADLAGATVITCYLLPELQPPLLVKLRHEAAPGTRIVSHEFVFPDWPPERTEIIRVGPRKVSQIYLWHL